MIVPAGTPANDEIARVAHAIWEAEGQPEGCDHEHWMRARQLIEEGRAEVEFPPAAAPREVSPAHRARCSLASKTAGWLKPLARPSPGPPTRIMAPRAIWKGHLEIGQLVCPVALHAAASTAERVAFHIVNRRTGHRVRRVFVDAETGEPVERDDQAKGYETDRGKMIVVEEEELAEAVPESDKTLHVEAFIPCGEVDTLYFDRPYYLTPDGEAAATAFAVIRAGLAKRKAAAIARTVLFRRLRAVLIRAQGTGLVADTLEFDHEVRDAAKIFDDIPELKLDKEMLDLARHIIDTKRGKFQPERFEDRYDDALAALVKAKAEGKTIPKPKPPEAAKPIDLMEALRKSAAAKAKAKAPAKRAASRRKAG